MWNNERIAFLLLGIYLVLDGIVRLTGGTAISVVLGLLALVAGVLLLLNYIPRAARRRR